MILGDKRTFALELDRFEPPWRVIGASESVWGTLALWIGGSLITEHRRVGTDRVRSEVNIPLIPLAQWVRDSRLVLRYEERLPFGSLTPHGQVDRWGIAPPPAGLDDDAWMDRRDEWWETHFTGAATADLVIPSLGIVRNDDDALISWRVPELPRPDRVFSNSQGSAVVSWLELRAVLDDFVALVEDWAPADALATSEIGASVRSPLELYTGLQRNEVLGFDFLPSAEDEPAIDPLAQILRDLSHSTATGAPQAEIVETARSVEEPGTGRWRELRDRLFFAGDASFEDVGYLAAQSTRESLNLDGQPLDDLDSVLRDMDIAISPHCPAAPDRMVVAARVTDGGATVMLLDNGRTATHWGRRFELARALGHVLLDPDRQGAIGAASGGHALASRRRRTGAFAAEFLLPTSALDEASQGALDGVTEGDRFRSLLERYGVGANTAAFQLWNQGFLSTREVRDDLIASVAATA